MTTGTRYAYDRADMVKRRRLKSSPASPLDPTSLNEKLITEFCKLTVLGMPADLVCDYLGISSTDYYTWLRRGQKPTSPDDAGCVDFIRRYRRATAQYRQDQINKLHKAKGNGWIKHMAILERRDRKTFGRNEPAGGSDEEFAPDDKFL